MKGNPLISEKIYVYRSVKYYDLAQKVHSIIPQVSFVLMGI